MTDERLINIDSYQLLANAIIKCAANDYVAMYGAKNDAAKRSAEKIEYFFYGDEFALFTGGNIDPDYIIKNLRLKAKRRKK